MTSKCYDQRNKNKPITHQLGSFLREFLQFLLEIAFDDGKRHVLLQKLAVLLLQGFTPLLQLLDPFHLCWHKRRIGIRQLENESGENKWKNSSIVVRLVHVTTADVLLLYMCYDNCVIVALLLQ